MNADEFPTQTGNFFGFYEGGDNSDDTLWTIHESDSWVVGGVGTPADRTVRWSLKVCDNGIVQTSRKVPYDGAITYSTRDRPNRPDKSSEFRMSREAVLEKHAAECANLGGDVTVDELRESMRAVLRRDDVATNGTSGIDLLAGGE